MPTSCACVNRHQRDRLFTPKPASDTRIEIRKEAVFVGRDRHDRHVWNVDKHLKRRIACFRRAGNIVVIALSEVECLALEPLFEWSLAYRITLW